MIISSILLSLMILRDKQYLIKKFGLFLSGIWIISCIINLIGIEWIESYNNYSIEAIYTCKSKQIGNYIGISVFGYGLSGYTYNEANNFCINKFNTSLSSIHSDKDLCANSVIRNLTANHNALIGLIYDNSTNINIDYTTHTVETNINGWHWADGTKNDYIMTLHQL